MSLRRKTGAERKDLQECRCRFHSRSANSFLPERWSLQRCVRFMEIFDPRTDDPASTRQTAEYFGKRPWMRRLHGASRVAMPS
ncbi:hypothetical protein, partial [Mesorhizobium sp.]|uniref:hypothetical protein n=1 Tax=Mesorhizobium sp. TaxID=1871066 RepID=UPI00257F223E